MKTLLFVLYVFLFFNEAEFSLFSMINLAYLKPQIFFEIEINIILTVPE